MTIPTPDEIATALVASAKALDVDPIAALTVKGHPARKCLAPAIEALTDRNIGTRNQLCRILRTHHATVARGWRIDKISDVYRPYKWAFWALVDLRQAQGTSQ